MHTVSKTRQLITLGVVICLLVGLGIFILVSAITHHIVVAFVLVLAGVVAIGMSWPQRRRLFFTLLFGGITLSLVGSAMFLFVGLYVEMIAAIMLMFFGGISLAVLVMARQFFGSGTLSPAQQQRAYQTFLHSLRDKAP